MAAKRPFVDFAEVRQKVTMPDLLRALNLYDRFQWNAQGTKARGVCPIPSHVHGPSPNADQFHMDLTDGKDGPRWLFHCFSTDCQKGGGVIELAKELTGLDDAHVRFFLAEQFGHLLTLTKPNATRGGEKAGRSAEPAIGSHPGAEKPPAQAHAPPAEPAPPLHEETAPVKKDEAPEQPQRACPKAPSTQTTTVPDAADGFKILKYPLKLDFTHPYLTERGIREETARAWGVGYCLNPKSMMSGYVVFPLYHPHQPEAVVGFLGRWPGEGSNDADRPRYKLPAGFQKSKVLFGWPQALQAATPVLIVEGAFSVLALAQAGYVAVATIGAQLSDDQATLLASLQRPLVLCYDGDAAGQQGMRTAAGKLITRSCVRVCRLAEEEQPDTLNAEQLKSYLSFIPLKGGVP